MAKELRTPAEVFCLAELLLDEIDARGWKTTEEIAIRMHTSRGPWRDLLIVDLIMCVQSKKDGFTIDDQTFKGLSTAFGVSEDFFRNIVAAWRDNPEKRSPFECPDRVFSTTSWWAVQ